MKIRKLKIAVLLRLLRRPKETLVQHAFPRIALIGYQTTAFILSFFRNVVSESNQIDSLKNAQDDPKDSNCRYKMAVLEKDGNA